MERDKPDPFVRRPDGFLGVNMTPEQRQATMDRYKATMLKMGVDPSGDKPLGQTLGFWKTPDGKELLPRR